MFLTFVFDLSQLASFYFRLLGWKELTQQAWVAPTLHIFKKGLSSRLALGQFPRDELCALIILLLIGVFFVCLRFDVGQWQFYQIVYANNITCSVHLFLYA